MAKTNHTLSGEKKYQESKAAYKIDWTNSGFDRGPDGVGRISRERFTHCGMCSSPVL
jgi:hypothetical protein